MTHILRPIFTLTVSVAILCLNSCSSNSEKNNTTEANKDSVASAQADSAKSPTVNFLSLPAPMQVASAIKKNCPSYHAELLCPLKSGASTNVARTINLGMYAVDLGYANVYEQKQTSINYFLTSVKLADELKIMGSADPALLKSFKDNINNKDSVTRYTLSSFGKIHDNLTSSNRNEEAFLILAGSFIEGVYLSSKIQAIHKDEKLTHLVGEQKLFLESLISLFSKPGNQKEVTDLSAQLTDLKSTYDKVQIAYSEMDPAKKQMQPIAISPEVLKEINEKITAIRNSVILTQGS